MLFHTPEFFVLMIATLALYYWLPKQRIMWLTIANFIFYGVSGIGFLALFLVVSTITFLNALAMGDRFRKLWLWISIVLNVLNLSFFKYSVFILGNMEQVFNLNLVTENSFWLTIVLPIGISFYTFELISYTVDVYKRKIEPTRSLLHFWIFIAFFAHLIAGPIMRGHEFLPQIERIRNIRWSADQLRLGAFFLGMGLIKKILLADQLSVLADQYFNKITQIGGAEGWMGSYLFAFQIYFDFSAYSDMAIGIGFLFGFELPRNFITPYLSANATEFWRRWHITLSNWIRDYIYIPLGGSRSGKARQLVNLFAAMVISGIWHGAMWTFVIWGAFHGMLLIVHKLFSDTKKRFGLDKWDGNIIYRFIAIAIFFQITCIGWVFFRAGGLQEALVLLGKMLSPEALQFSGIPKKYIALIIGLFALHIIEYNLLMHKAAISRFWHNNFPAPVRAIVYTVIIAVLLIFLQGEHNSFIYFQF